MVERALVGDPWLARRTVVIVPTRAAGAVLRRELESSLVQRVEGPQALVWPHLLTRDSWYREMHARAGVTEGLLSPADREVCMLSAARTGEEPPFRLRPGLVPSIVDFYDQLLRHGRSIDGFARLMTAELEPSVDLDRGARRLLRQTDFLVSTFRRYEERLAESGRMDEHSLRAFLTEPGAEGPFTRVVVAVADHVVDPTGLWPADYDLLTRLPALDEMDIVATDRVLDAGLHERPTERLPGIAEEHVVGRQDSGPLVVTPTEGESNHFVFRDREEELLSVARSVKLSAREDRVDRVAVVFRRPLPYLYLARDLLDAAGIPSRSYDGFPLAAEPFAAAVDLVCTFVTSGYDRSSTAALLRSPHFDFGQPLGSTEEGADEALRTTLVGELEPLDRASEASAKLEALGAFLAEHAVTLDPPSGFGDRETRARTAICRLIDDLAAAHGALDQSDQSTANVVAMLRRWIEGQTIVMDSDAEGDGVHLIDPRAASFGQFDELFMVGLVDGEWPGRPAGNIFYPSSLLIPLGWPVERDRMRAARAQFADLLELPRHRVALSTILFENDAIVTPSTLLEEIGDVGLSRVPSRVDFTVCVTPDDAMALSFVDPGDLSEPTSSWVETRATAADRSAPRFHGVVGPRQAETYAVGALERYLDCPFKYLSERVLKLGEESSDERVSAAQRRGLFLHGLFESFFSTWRDASGGCSITIANLGAALERFGELAEKALDRLPTSDRAVTRSWTLGSAAAPGLAERLFLLEVGHPTDVVGRLTEFRVDGSFVLDGADQPRPARLRGVVDRIDLFANGTFRVVDYKANRAPDRNRALQLPLYARCAEQQLAGHRGRDWQAVDATYAAFGEPRIHRPIGRSDFAQEVTEGERRAADVLDRIERGEFPVQPAEPFRCTFCAYPTVCRKDYVGDD